MYFPRLKELRLEQGYTRQEVSEATGIDVDILRLLEDGPAGSFTAEPFFHKKTQPS